MDPLWPLVEEPSQAGHFFVSEFCPLLKIVGQIRGVVRFWVTLTN